MPDVLHEETLPGGAARSFTLRQGLALRLRAEGPDANVSALFFSAAQSLERYNMPDTLKSQYTAYLTAGRVLHSDMGRALCSILADSCGWHDTIGGHLDARRVAEKYGALSYQEARNGRRRNARDNFLVELGKHGLGKRDLHANVNFFSKVAVNDAGDLLFATGHSRARDFVELRAEMDLLVVLSNTPHPLAPAGTWNPPPVTLSVRRVPPPGPDDLCRTSRPENERAFINSETRHLLETA